MANEERSEVKKMREELDAALKRLDTAENTIKKILEGMKEAEKEVGEPLMPSGEYYGEAFV